MERDIRTTIKIVMSKNVSPIMKNPTKLHLSVWISSITTFTVTAMYILSQEERINAPGELGEVFTATGFIILIALAIFSAISALIFKKQ